ncbi:hypothetical protein K474DRAFT_486376 [Panus rudis PR-1116 ss-1]|nr:hypothetical protein K474DRAFT_486376 [Panus rudis PR-1116 ss-1]
MTQSTSTREGDDVLPIELCEQIIDWCGFLPPPSLETYAFRSHERYNTLMSCALVCRAWYPRSQVRLVQDVCLQAIRGPEKVLQFVRTLREKPQLRNYVFGIKLDVPNDPTWVFLLLGPRLPRLKYLHIYGSLYVDEQHPLDENVRHPMFFNAVSQYQSVRWISVTQDEHVDIESLIRLWQGLPNVTHLDARSGLFLPLSWDGAGVPDIGLSRIRRTHLDCLILPHYDTTTALGGDASILLHILLKAPSTVAQLNRLWISMLSRGSREYSELLAKLYRLCGTSLRELVISYTRSTGKTLSVNPLTTWIQI